MAKAQPTAHDKIRAAIARAQAGNGRSLAALIGDVPPGDLAECIALAVQLTHRDEWSGLEVLLGLTAHKQAERERIKAEKREAQRAARAALRAKLGAEYLGGVAHVSG